VRDVAYCETRVSSAPTTNIAGQPPPPLSTMLLYSLDRKVLAEESAGIRMHLNGRKLSN
jgi:hypothetical protein